jgi:hypothetical protein
VALGALAPLVTSRAILRMAGGAVRIAGMIKVDVVPGRSVVATAAQTGPVPIRWLVAGFTIQETGVVKVHVRPTVNIVAIGTEPLIVPRWSRMAHLAVALVGVLE